MKDFLKNNWATFLMIIVLAVLIYSEYQNKEFSPKYDTEYCVEWENGITRETLSWKCYNFEKQRINCDWYVQEKDDLLIFIDYYNRSKVITDVECVRYAPSRYIEPEQTEINLTKQIENYIEEVDKIEN